MKIVILTLFFLINSFNCNYAQPIFEVGNRWYFFEGEWNAQGQGYRDTICYEIVGDTLMPNGNKYFRMYPPSQWFKDLMRADSNGIYYYDTTNNIEWQFYKYDLEAGYDDYTNNPHVSVGYNQNDLSDSSRYINIYKWNEYNTFIFGDSTKTYNYYNDTGLDDSYFIQIMPKYGFYGIDYSDMFSNYGLTLIACKLSNNTYGDVTSVETYETIPTSEELYQNYPNPFNPTTIIKYKLDKQSNVQLVLFDILGNKINELVKGIKSPGQYYYNLDASSLPSGVYIYQLRTNTKVLLRKMLLAK